MTGIAVLILRVLLVIALYAFLGTALWVMWRQLAQTSQQMATSQVPRIRLEVRTADQMAVARTFTQPEITLGRDPLSDFPLADEAISARHALLSFHDGQWWVRDLGSKNGTRLNAARVTLPTVLVDGDEIRCGQTLLNISLEGTPSNDHSPDEGGPNG